MNGLPKADHAAEPARNPYARVTLDLGELAEVAHTLWLASGCAYGRDVDNWYAAIEIVRARGPR